MPETLKKLREHITFTSFFFLLFHLSLFTLCTKYLRKYLSYFTLYTRYLRKYLSYFTLCTRYLRKYLSYFTLCTRYLRKYLSYFTLYTRYLRKYLSYFTLYTRYLRKYLSYFTLCTRYRRKYLSWSFGIWQTFWGFWGWGVDHLFNPFMWSRHFNLILGQVLFLYKGCLVSFCYCHVLYKFLNLMQTV